MATLTNLPINSIVNHPMSSICILYADAPVWQKVDKQTKMQVKNIVKPRIQSQ